MAGLKTYRVVTLVASSPYSFATGTTATSTGTTAADKGVEVTFQNQSTGSPNIYIGGPDLTISISATSTTGVGGIQIAPGGSYTVGKRHAPSAIQMSEWFVISTSSNATCVAQLLKAV